MGRIPATYDGIRHTSHAGDRGQSTIWLSTHASMQVEHAFWVFQGLFYVFRSAA